MDNAKSVTTLKLTLPIYYEILYKTKKNKKVLIGLNFYRNAHHFLNNKIKRRYHNIVAKQVQGLVLKTPCKVKNTLYLARNGTDGHNIAPIALKYTLDGLVKSGVIPDDSNKYILGDSTDYFIDKNNPRIEIELFSV